MQDNLAYVMSRKVLFDNDSQAFTGVITLPETAANFSCLEIGFKTDDNAYGSVNVWHPNGKIVTCTTNYMNGVNVAMYVKSKSFKINGTSISTYSLSGGWFTGIWGNNISAQVGDYIAITQVVGYR